MQRLGEHPGESVGSGEQEGETLGDRLRGRVIMKKERQWEGAVKPERR